MKLALSRGSLDAPRSRRVLLLTALVAVLLPATASGQRVIVERGPGEGVVLRELGALVGMDPDDDALRVLLVPDVEQRPAPYRQVDLAAGDRILAINGRRVRSSEELAAAYQAIEVGQEVQLGIERGAGDSPLRRIVRFPKADPATLPQPQMRIVRIEGGGEGDGEVEVMPALGAVLRQGEAPGSPVEVAAVLPGGEETFRDGDRLVSADGEAIAELGDFTTRWDALEVGEATTLVLANGDQRRTARVTKREPPPGMRLHRRTDGQ